jgi:AcrR family transcriptional regulator
MARKAESQETAAARQRLLAAGVELFANRPYDAVSIDDIADKAGAAHGLLFHYFKTKLDFYVEVYRIFAAKLHAQRVAATQHGTPEARLRSFIELHMHVFRDRRASHFYHIRGGAPAKVLAVAEASRREGVLLVLSYFATPPPSPIQILLGRSWLGFVDELILGWLQNDAIPETGVVETCLELYFEVVMRTDLVTTGARPSKARLATLSV